MVGGIGASCQPAFGAAKIATNLVVSLKTVEAHISRLRSKLGIASRAEIALWAAEQELIAPVKPTDP